MKLIHEQAVDYALSVAQDVADKYRNNTDNETLATLVWEAYADACDGLDLPCYEEAFDAAFPELVPC
jgi:hypothetical protein